MNRRMLLESLLKTSRLPSAYQEVEYLRSTGTQWIDTQLQLTSTTGVSFDAKYNIPESLEAKTPEAFGKYYQQVCLFESEFRQRIISTYTMDQVAEKLESIYGQAAASEPNMHFSTDAKAVKSEDMLLYLASIINSDSVEFHKKVWEAIADKRFEKAVLFPQLYDVRILYAQM